MHCTTKTRFVAQSPRYHHLDVVLTYFAMTFCLNSLSLQIKKLLTANKPALCAVFEHYASSLASPKQGRKRRQSSDAAGQEGPKRRMSMAHLCQLCSDFGILPMLCDVFTVQVREKLLRGL